jgi:hypothetical protein
LLWQRTGNCERSTHAPYRLGVAGGLLDTHF